jgi:hypothetical protein
MKFIITENKRYQLAYKILDKILDGFTRKDFDLNVDTIYSNQQIVFIDNNGEIVMRWTESNGNLYVSSEIDSTLSILSLSEMEVNRLLFRWFTDRVRIEPDNIYFTDPGSLDWDGNGLGGLSNLF